MKLLVVLIVALLLVGQKRRHMNKDIHFLFMS